MVRENEAAEAQNIAQLLRAKALGGSPIRKVAIDSDEFDTLLQGGTIEQPNNTHLNHAFALFRDWVASQSLPDLGSFLYRLLNQCLIIRLNVGDAKDAFKLFETINNRGLRLSPTDIIKNFLLGNAARLDGDALAMAKAKWAEIILNLDGLNQEQFFRQFLCASLRQRITHSHVIMNFKKLFMQSVVEAKQLPDRHVYLEDDVVDDDVEKDNDAEVGDEAADRSAEADRERVTFAHFLNHLAGSAKSFAQIVRCRSGVASIDRHLRNLRMIKFQQCYGFLMYLRRGGCGDGDFVQILRLTEALLIRRSICKMRSNETESLFARLCSLDCRNAVDKVAEEYRLYTPSGEKFRDDFAATRFFASLIDRARYCLEQFEFKRHGSFPELSVNGPDAVHVEHIMPQKIRTKKAKAQFGDWPTYLGPQADAHHEKHVSRIGNLTLFAGPLNIGASSNPYERKKQAYTASAIKITNTLPHEYPEFRIEDIERRSSALADLAVGVWPRA